MNGSGKSIWKCCPFLLVALLFFITALLLVSFAYFEKETMRELVLEDGVIENIQAVLFLLGAIVSIVTFNLARKAGKSRRRRQLFYFLFFLMFLFFFLEEISYGQRIFGITTPDDLQDVNLQDETNIHNIGIGKSLLWIHILMALFLVIVGIALPILKLGSERFKALIEKWQFPVSSHNLISCFAMALVIFSSPGYHWYVPLFILAVIIPIVIILSGKFMEFFSHFDHPSVQFCLVMVLGLVIIALNTNSETSDNLAHNIAFEIRELLIAMALFFFAFFEMRKSRERENQQSLD